MVEEIDVEALQAQIDLSNSIAFDLVSTWMKPTTSNNISESASQVIARELEEHAKRPPRLGLGAAVSKSSVATSREAARLKGKLMGTKRTRDEGKGVSTLETGGDSEDVEDEDESRSAAISRSHALPSTRGVCSRNKKNRENRDKNAQNATVSNIEFTSPKPNPLVLPDSPGAPSLAEQSILNLASPSPVPPDTSAKTSTSSKKKPKHKKKKVKTPEEDIVPVEDAEWTGFSNHTLARIDTTPIPVEEHPNIFQKTAYLSPPHRTPKTSTSVPSTPSPVDVPSPVLPTPSPSCHTHVKNSSQNHPMPHRFFPPQLTDQPVPVLNLNGPPPDAQPNGHEELGREKSESPIRKRPKRKRRKRSKTSRVGEV